MATGPAAASDKYRAPALEKGLDILELLAARADGLSQGEIARGLDRSPNEIFRMLSVLEQRGYITRAGGDDRYRLSLKLFALSHTHPPIRRLTDMAVPLMREAANATHQSCHLGAEANGEIVVIASVPSPGNWGLSLREGAVIGLGNTGTGRVLAAFRSDEDLSALLDRHTLASGEPRLNRTAFLKALAAIRKKGFDRASSDTTVGVTNLAFPVFDSEGRAVAVLSCPYLERIDRLRVPGIKQVERHFADLAKQLTDLNGGSPPAHLGG